MRKILLTLTLTIYTLTSIAQQCDTLPSKASFYHSRYNGRRTTSGDIYNEKKPSAASNNYPLGTKLLIINKSTGQTVTVVVNDRMSKQIRDRIDLSKFAFKQIGRLAEGIQKISIVKIL